MVFERKSPPPYWVLIDEFALMRAPAAKATLLEQLRHVEEVSANPQITVQVIPMRAGVHGMMGGNLSLWTLKDGRAAAMGESFGPGEPIENPARVSHCSNCSTGRNVKRFLPAVPRSHPRIYQGIRE